MHYKKKQYKNDVFFVSSMTTKGKLFDICFKILLKDFDATDSFI